MVKVARNEVENMASMSKGPTSSGERKGRKEEEERGDCRLTQFCEMLFLSSYSDQSCTRQSFGSAVVRKLPIRAQLLERFSHKISSMYQ
jgi:hypothetical protein